MSELPVNHLQGKIIEPLKPNEIILTLFEYKGSQGLLVSGVIYRSIEQAQKNLAAFKPIKTIFIKVELPNDYNQTGKCI